MGRDTALLVLGRMCEFRAACAWHSLSAKHKATNWAQKNRDMACVLKPTIPYSIFQKHARGNCSDVRDLFVLKRCTWQLIPLTDSLCLAEPVCLSELLGMVVTPFISRSLSSAIKLTRLPYHPQACLTSAERKCSGRKRRQSL
jgi:hypothetical protein